MLSQCHKYVNGRRKEEEEQKRREKEREKGREGEGREGGRERERERDRDKGTLDAILIQLTCRMMRKMVTPPPTGRSMPVSNMNY